MSEPEPSPSAKNAFAVKRCGYLKRVRLAALVRLRPSGYFLGTTLDLMHAALSLRLANPLPRGCMQVFVVLLRFFGDDDKEKMLLPFRWLAGAIKPSVGRLAWTTQRRHDYGCGIRGEIISEGHGQILPQKKKYAMQKINLAKCPHCRQSAHMSKTNRTALENAIAPAINITGTWTGNDGKTYRSFRYWLNEGWSQSFMQVQEITGWVTLY